VVGAPPGLDASELWGRASVAVVGWSLHDVDDREARVGVEAGGGEERSAEVAGEERVAADA
jgi:hypothetical protein